MQICSVIPELHDKLAVPCVGPAGAGLGPAWVGVAGRRLERRVRLSKIAVQICSVISELHDKIAVPGVVVGPAGTGVSPAGAGLGPAWVGVAGRGLERRVRPVKIAMEICSVIPKLHDKLAEQ